MESPYRLQNPLKTPGHLHMLSVIHYNYVIMSVMASQITSLMIVYSTVYSGAYQRKHQSSASLTFVRGIHRWPVDSPHKGPVTWNVSTWWRHHVIIADVEPFGAHVSRAGPRARIQHQPHHAQALVGTYYFTWFNFPTWISDYIHYKPWDEITYPFPNFNAAPLMFGNG